MNSSPKITLVSLGCRVNQYEATAIFEEFKKIGAVKVEKDADICIINTCAVTEESCRKSRQTVRRIIKHNPNAFVVVMGCASQLDYGAFSDIEGVSFVCGCRNKLEIIEAYKNYSKGNEYARISVNSPDGKIEDMNISSFERTRAYVKIQDGCDGKCAYCVIPSVRGGIVTRERDSILCEIKRLADNGCHEIVLTGIETASYGKELGTLISDVSKINGIERIRLGSMEPSFLKKDFIDTVASVHAFCPHFHVSVQSGSSDTLKNMKRKYNREQLEENLDYIRKKIPDCNFTCDIIVGFPGETDEDFNESVSLVRREDFLHCHIFRYSPRPGTVAEKMTDRIPSDISEKRLHILENEAFESKKRVLNKLISNGKPIKVLTELILKNGYVTGHSDGFVECKVKTDSNVSKGDIFSFVPTDISEDGYLMGDIIND